MITQLTLAKSYTLPEHLEKLMLYLGAILPLLIGLILFLGFGIWCARKIWFGHFTDTHESRKATQDILRKYASTVDEHTQFLETLGGNYKDKLQQLSLRDNNISELKDQVSNMSSDYASLNSRCRDLENLSSGYKGEIATLKKQLNDRINEIEGLKKLNIQTAKEKEIEAKRFSHDLLEKIGELDAKSNLIEELRATIAKREGVISELEVQKLSAEKKVEQKEAFISEKIAEIDELNGIHLSLNNELIGQKDQLEIGLNNRGKQIADLEKQLKARGIDVINLSQENETMRGQLTAFETELSNVELVVQSRDALIRDFEDRVKGQDAEIATVTAENDTMRGQLTAFEAELSNVELVVQSRDASIRDLEERVKVQNVEITTINADNETMRGQLAEFEAELSTVRLDVESRDSLIGDLEERVKVQDIEITTINGDNETMRGHLAEFRTEYSTLEEKLETKDNTIVELEELLKNREVEISSLGVDNDLIAGQLAEFEAELSNLVGSNSDKDAEISRLLSEVEDKYTLSLNLKDRDNLIESLQKDLEASKGIESELAQLTEVLKGKDGEISRFIVEAKADKDRFTEMESELAQLSCVLEGKDDEIRELLEQAKEKDALSQLLAEMEDAILTKDSELAGMRSNEDQLADKLANRDSKLSAFMEQAEESDNRLSAALAELKMTESELQKVEEEFAAAFTPMGSFRDEENVVADDRLGVIFTERPQEVDDLKLINGVAAVLEQRLNEFGVYRFKQIAVWEQGQIDAFSEELSFKDRINTDLWIHQAADLHRQKYAENLAPQVDIYKCKVVKEKPKPITLIEMFKGEKVVETDNLGILFKEQPSNVDDLKEIKGVAGVLEQQLNEHGVYQYKQIASWTPTQIEQFGEQLSFKDRIERDLWVHQAIDLHHDKYGEFLQPRSHLYNPIKTSVKAKVVNAKAKAPKAPAPFKNESVKEDEKFGIVFTKRPSEVDDLKLIKGVGGVLEKALNEFGVYRFKQIALWSENVVQEFVENLPFGDRVTRDNWIDQAIALHQDKYQEEITF